MYNLLLHSTDEHFVKVATAYKKFCIRRAAKGICGVCGVSGLWNGGKKISLRVRRGPAPPNCARPGAAAASHRKTVCDLHACSHVNIICMHSVHICFPHVITYGTVYDQRA